MESTDGDTMKKKKKVAIVLVMHGVPPKDFPVEDKNELLMLHHRLHSVAGPEASHMKRRHDELAESLLGWQRTPKNDPFFTASGKIAESLNKKTGWDVFLGFNEFCRPTVSEAMERAARAGAKKIVVVTPMMTRGGEHSEKDIPEAIEMGRRKFPEIEIVYAWPFGYDEIADFLSAHIERFV